MPVDQRSSANICCFCWPCPLLLHHTAGTNASGQALLRHGLRHRPVACALHSRPEQRWTRACCGSWPSWPSSLAQGLPSERSLCLDCQTTACDVQVPWHGVTFNPLVYHLSYLPALLLHPATVSPLSLLAVSTSNRRRRSQLRTGRSDQGRWRGTSPPREACATGAASVSPDSDSTLLCLLLPRLKSSGRPWPEVGACPRRSSAWVCVLLETQVSPGRA